MTEFITQGSGNWNSITPNQPWLSGTVPSPTDTVVISGGHTVTLTDNREIAGITGTGILISNNSSVLTVNFDARTDSCGVKIDGNLNLIKTGILGTGILTLTNCYILATGLIKIQNGTVKVTHVINRVPVTVVGNNGTDAKLSVFDPSAAPIVIGKLTLGDGTGYGIVRSSTNNSLLGWDSNIGLGIVAVGSGNLIDDNSLTIMGGTLINNSMTIQVDGDLDIKCRIDHNNGLRKTGEGTLRISYVHTNLTIFGHVDAGTLLVNGRINGGNYPVGSMTVHNGATLGGNGIIDSNVVVLCGTLSPGDPLIDAGVGTLTVRKDSFS